MADLFIRIRHAVSYPASIAWSVPPATTFIPHNIEAAIIEIPTEVVAPVAAPPVIIPPPGIPPYIMHTVVSMRVVYPVAITPVGIIPVFIVPIFIIIFLIFMVYKVAPESTERYNG
jgi:hypothetical protein